MLKRVLEERQTYVYRSKEISNFIGRVISLILRLGNFIVKPWQHLVAKVYD